MIQRCGSLSGGRAERSKIELGSGGVVKQVVLLPASAKSTAHLRRFLNIASAGRNLPDHAVTSFEPELARLEDIGSRMSLTAPDVNLKAACLF